MKCPNCKQEIDNNSAFCEYCGAKIKKSKKVLWVILGVVTIAVVIGTIAIVGFKQQSDDYVDLGLPSGTLWSSTNAGGNAAYYTYDEAINLFGDKLPTQQQYQELIALCKWKWQEDGYKVIGDNGNFIYLPSIGVSCLFWDLYNNKEVLPYLCLINEKYASLNNDFSTKPTDALEEYRRQNPLFSCLFPAMDNNGQPDGSYFIGTVHYSDTALVRSMLTSPIALNILPKDFQFEWNPHAVDEEGAFFQLLAVKSLYNGGDYWSSSRDYTRNDYAYCLLFDQVLPTICSVTRFDKRAVRLVK